MIGKLKSSSSAKKKRPTTSIVRFNRNVSSVQKLYARPPKTPIINVKQSRSGSKRPVTTEMKHHTSMPEFTVQNGPTMVPQSMWSTYYSRSSIKDKNSRMENRTLLRTMNSSTLSMMTIDRNSRERENYKLLQAHNDKEMDMLNTKEDCKSLIK